MLIIFKNWKEYNPDSIKTSSWLRLNSNIISRPIWDELDNNGFRVFIYILCQANENKPRGQIHISTRGVAGRCTVTEKVVNRTIEILKEFHVIDTRAPSVCFISSANPPHTYVRTNDTNVTHTPESAIPERLIFPFEKIYAAYPRKEGKHKGLLTCKAQIKTWEDFDLLLKAVLKYSENCKLSATAPRFVKHFSTFMNSWRDWADPTTGTEPAREMTAFAKLVMEKKNGL